MEKTLVRLEHKGNRSVVHLLFADRSLAPRLLPLQQTYCPHVILDRAPVFLGPDPGNTHITTNRCVANVKDTDPKGQESTTDLLGCYGQMEEPSAVDSALQRWPGQQAADPLLDKENPAHCLLCTLMCRKSYHDSQGVSNARDAICREDLCPGRSLVIQ